MLPAVRRSPHATRLTLALSCALLSLGLVGPAAAAPRAVVAGVPSDPFAARVGAELRTQGFEVLFDGGPADLPRVILRHGARAALRPRSAPPAVEVLVVDDAGAAVVAELLTGDDEGVLAVRATELVRAVILRGASGDTPADARTLSLAAGASLGGGPGGLGPVGHLRLGAVVLPDARWALELAAALPLAGGRVREDAGAADASTLAAAIGLRLRLGAPRAAFVPDAALAVGVASTRASRVEGEAPTLDAAVTGLVTARAGLTWRALPRLGLRAEVGVSSFLPPTVVKVDGVEIARLGLPLFYGALSVVVEL